MPIILRTNSRAGAAWAPIRGQKEGPRRLIYTIQPLFRLRRADSQTAASSVIWGMSCCGCGALVRPPVFVRWHGPAGLRVCRDGQPPTHEQAWRNISFCASLRMNRVDSSPRPFLLSSYRCPSSTGSAVGPKDDRHWLTQSGCGAECSRKNNATN